MTQTDLPGAWPRDLGQRARNTARPILLVGFLEQGNLGLGYLAATLQEAGYAVLVADVERSPEELVETACRERPLLIGFSLIFQFYIGRYATLIRQLRAAGIDCHFTMGGHFPSLSPAQTLAQVPELDSVVRFEGELTLLELADHVGNGTDWRATAGIVYHDAEGGLAQTGPRHLLRDLDDLPWPVREFEPEQVLAEVNSRIIRSRSSRE